MWYFQNKERQHEKRVILLFKIRGNKSKGEMYEVVQQLYRIRHLFRISTYDTNNLYINFFYFISKPRLPSSQVYGHRSYNPIRLWHKYLLKYYKRMVA